MKTKSLKSPPCSKTLFCTLLGAAVLSWGSPFKVAAQMAPTQSKGLDGFKKEKRKYSPVRGMLVQNNNWLDNVYSKVAELDPDHPAVKLAQQLFTKVPGETGLKSTTKASVPAALLSGNLIGKIFEIFESERKAISASQPKNVDLAATALAKKVEDLILKSEEYKNLVAESLQKTKELEEHFDKLKGDFEEGQKFAQEKEELIKGPLGKLTTKMFQLKKDMDNLQQQLEDLSNPQIAKANDEKPVNPKQKELEDKFANTEKIIKESQQQLLVLQEKPLENKEAIEKLNQKVSSMSKFLLGLTKQLENISKQPQKAVPVKVGPTKEEIEKKIVATQQAIDETSKAMAGIAEKVVVLEKKIVPNNVFRAKRQDFEHAKKSVAVGTEDYLKELGQVAANIAGSFYAADLKLGKDQTPLFGPTTTTDMLLGYLWGKYAKKADLKGYLEEANKQKMLTINLDDKFYGDTFGENDYKSIAAAFLPHSKLKKNKRAQWLSDNWGLALTYQIVKPNGKHRPVFTPYKQHTPFHAAGYKFSNCAENSLRNLIFFLLFDEKTGNIDQDLIKELEEKKGFKILPALKAFIKKHPNFEDVEEMDYHAEFNDVVSELNTPLPEANIQYVHGYSLEFPKGRCEIKPDRVNFMKTFEALLGQDVEATIKAVNELRNRHIHHYERKLATTLGLADQTVYEDEKEKYGVAIAFEVKHISASKEDNSPAGEFDQVVDKIQKVAGEKYLEGKAKYQDSSLDMVSLGVTPFLFKAMDSNGTLFRENAIGAIRDTFRALFGKDKLSRSFDQNLPQLLLYKKGFSVDTDIPRLFKVKKSKHPQEVFDRNIALMEQVGPDSPLFKKMVEYIKENKLVEYDEYLATKKDSDQCKK